ncbi:mammalian cell entry protein [Mycolicibacterium duvalii]|uniref:Mammalian cell entry protein n=1 Tax=Mycolicibacterium duvalii TaxID=39688 RepID=A0A7I7K0R2_9MYCO|nr:MlaD family protein [Mycolicibacterium duvalii]MCV7370939.1 MCE family protein [Mycolicibacterium duvalii]PEG41257.1 mammalian cell entry protein [Mycolicibacterium duvalii]BBX17194.1 mammalian cell entry protein [Mycolicibacterium duvalii]
MHLTRRIWIQLAIFVVVSLVAISVMAFGYVKLPRLLGVGTYQVTVELPEAGGLYERANVTYRGTEVGQVKAVTLNDGEVDAVLALTSSIDIPSDLDAEVHSVSAVGEQYIALLPRDGSSAPLKNGDVITRDRSSVPPDINELLNATNRGLEAIPGDNLTTTVDEAYVALGGLGPELSRFIKGSTALAIDARANLDELTNVVDNVGPLLETQTDTSDSVQAWAANLAEVTQQLRDNDAAVRGVLEDGAPATEEVRALFDRLQPTLPVILSNLVAVGEVAVAYQPAIEQLLVLLPTGTEAIQAVSVANRNTKQDYKGAFLSFNLNLNLPSVCNTGFLPPQQQRAAAFEDYPDAPPGDIYCRVPQDSTLNVRGARNVPCLTRPGKRAPTAAMCESDEVYVPLNDGFNWKGDPNATVTGQAVPQPRTGTSPSAEAPAAAGAAPPAAPPPDIAVAKYDPATGTYIGPDGKVYTQSNLATDASKEQTWESMLIPPGS